MNCEQARGQFAAALMEGGATPALDEHLNRCALCSEELDTLRTHWAALGLLPNAEPSPQLRRGFYQALEAYRDGLADSDQRNRERWWQALWPNRPALQLALSLALLVAGAAAGYLTSQPRRDTAEVAQLRGEIGSLRQLITLSLLQQQSAVDRLQGVTWSYRVEQSDVEVLSALLRTINEDQNADVRLAAVDAMRSFAKSPVARRGLQQSLDRQRSPLVQIAIIDLLVELRERSAAPAIAKLLEKPDLDENVRKRVQTALSRLE